MNILFLIDSFSGGGAERIMSFLLKELDRKRFRVTLCLSLGDKISYELPKDIAVHYLLSPDNVFLPRYLSLLLRLISFLYNLPLLFEKGNFIQKYRSMFNYLKAFALSTRQLGILLDRERTDLLVSFLPNSNIIALLAKLVYKHDIPLCCSDHNLLSMELQSLPYASLYGLIIRRLYRHAQAYVAVSSDVKKDIVNNFCVPVQRATVIYNAIDNKAIQQARHDTNGADIEELFSGPRTVKIITAGRLTAQKAHEHLLHAFKYVKEQVDCKLFLLGDGELKPYLERLVQHLALQDDVHLIGWRKNPFVIMARCDLFVLSSRWEGFGNVIIEAMALGLPIISTDCPSGPSEILGQGKYGILVPPEDDKALANAIISLAKDPLLRKRYGNAGLKRSADFSLTQMVHAYESLFEELISCA